MSEIKINNIPVITENNGSVSVTTGTTNTNELNFVDGSASFISSDTNGYPRFTHLYGNAQIGLFRSGNSVGGGYIGANADASFIVLSESRADEHMRITSSGYVKMPYQPAFSSVKNGHQYPVSGSRDVITPWTSQLNIGGHFNNSTGVFTAPVSGTYFFYVSIMSDRNDSGDYQISIHKNGSMYVNSNDLHTANATFVQTTVPCVIYMPQNDTVDFRLYNSTLTATFIYSGNYSHCGGYLIG